MKEMQDIHKEVETAVASAMCKFKDPNISITACLTSRTKVSPNISTEFCWNCRKCQLVAGSPDVLPEFDFRKKTKETIELLPVITEICRKFK